MHDTDTERPYRITDFHGEVVADELDDVPPLLSQEETDTLAAFLEDQDLSDAALVSALRKLPDIEHGRGQLPAGFRPACHICGDEIETDADGVRAFGNYYHDDCTPDS